MKVILNINIAIILCMFTWCSCSILLKNKENVYIVKGYKKIDSLSKKTPEKAGTKQYNVKFINNPYNFDESYDCLFYLNDSIISVRKFSLNFSAIVPPKHIYPHSTPLLEIYKEGKTYTFLHFQTVNLTSLNDTIFIEFNPNAKKLIDACKIWS